MTNTLCFCNDITKWFCGCISVITFLLGLAVGILMGLCRNNKIIDSSGVSSCFERTKKLCIAAQNSSTLNKVHEQLGFLQDNGKIDIEQVKLETPDSKPDFRRVKYILCCAEGTSGRGIILHDTEPDQLGHITKHAKKAKAHCAILVLGKQDPPDGQLYDETRMANLTKDQPGLKEYRDLNRLFSFCSVLNTNQKEAILAWLGFKHPKVHGKAEKVVTHHAISDRVSVGNSEQSETRPIEPEATLV